MDFRFLGAYKKNNPEKIRAFLELIEFEKYVVSDKGVLNELHCCICLDLLGAEFIALNRSFFWCKQKRINKGLTAEIGRFLLYAENGGVLAFGLNIARQIIKFHINATNNKNCAKPERFIWFLKEVRNNLSYYIRLPSEINALAQSHLTKNLR